VLSLPHQEEHLRSALRGGHGPGSDGFGVCRGVPAGAARHSGNNKKVVHDAKGRSKDSRGQVVDQEVEARGEAIASKKHLKEGM